MSIPSDPPQSAEETVSPPVEINSAEKEIEQLRSERDEYKDKYLRLLAEGENARKRMQKEKQEYAQFAMHQVIVDFLQPIDQMESALSYATNMSEEVRHWAIGFEMILSQFKQSLTKQGVTVIETVGNQFDPYCHEALELLASDEHPAGTVVAESGRGYRIGDRTLRPARVTVAKAVEPVAEEEEVKEQPEN